MKKLWVLGLIILLMVSAGCNKKSANDKSGGVATPELESMGINGKITSIRTTTFSAIDKLGEISRDLFQSDEYFVYDTQGYQTESYVFLYDGQLDYKQTFKRDNQKRITDIVETYSDGTQRQKILYKYDEKGNKTDAVSYDSDNNLIWKKVYAYDQNDNNTELGEYGAEGTLESKTLYTYDENNNPKDMKVFDKYSHLIRAEEYTYTQSVNSKDKWLLTQQIDRNSDNVVIATRRYRFDANDLCDEQKITNDTMLEIVYTYKRTYDANNNVTRMISFRNGIPEDIIDMQYNSPNTAPKIATSSNAKSKPSIMIHDQSDVSKIASKWNTAHNEVRIDAFEELYADQVNFYGTLQSHDKVVATKKMLLTKSYIGFQQELSNVAIQTYDDGSARINFTKKTLYNGKTDYYQAYLEVVNVRNVWKITKESDTTTDRNLQ